MIRTRFAPSPTGYMHIGNLRTALYEYLIAKKDGGKFILRIEDTDKERFVKDAIDFIYNTLKIAGLKHDEGPDIGGQYAPYIQSERKDIYIKYAKELVEKGEAYYCFCTKERLESLRANDQKDIPKYDRHCLSLSKEEIEQNIKNGVPFVIRQKINEGSTTFKDEVYGEITIENDEIEDQILIKSDGYPTYNFANVIDDHLMQITHIVRGSEYLTSTPKYNLLYKAFGWEIPTYIHLPQVMKNKTEKLSKRNGDASFNDLIEKGYLPEAIINYIALLGWSPSDNKEFFTLEELIEQFDIKGLSKSPAIFDINKLNFINSEYIKNMDFESFKKYSIPILQNIIFKDYDLSKISEFIKTRISAINKEEIEPLVSFIQELPEYDKSLYFHKKFKTDEEICTKILKNIIPIFQDLQNFKNDEIYNSMVSLAENMQAKNGAILWTIRTALSGKESSPCSASEMAELFGKQETIKRIEKGLEKFS